MATAFSLDLCAAGASTYTGAAGWETNSTSPAGIHTKKKSQEKVRKTSTKSQKRQGQIRRILTF
jgi:hypothetical protein